MKKNGFIATSLIYSFFLIFITLFLTIIADYLQNKVLLNTIEKGIKDELNSTIGINDFEVGDLISFVNDCDNFEFVLNNSYVIANIDYENNNLILYSYGLCDNDNGCVETSNQTILTNFDDIPSGNQNASYYNKIIYNFDKSNSETYSVGSKYYSLKNDRVCNDGNIYNTLEGCEVLESTNYIRYKVIETVTNRYNKCDIVENDAMGVIYLQK